jgi:hypothetical protein
MPGLEYMQLSDVTCVSDGSESVIIQSVQFITRLVLTAAMALSSHRSTVVANNSNSTFLL